MADLAFNGLHSYLKEKLEGFDFIMVNHLQMRAVGVEFKYKKSKDSFKPHRSNTHVVENNSDCSDDEFVWPSKDKPSMCPSLKPVQKNRQNETKFTFDVSKCDRMKFTFDVSNVFAIRKRGSMRQRRRGMSTSTSTGP